MADDPAPFLLFSGLRFHTTNTSMLAEVAYLSTHSKGSWQLPRPLKVAFASNNTLVRSEHCKDMYVGDVWKFYRNEWYWKPHDIHVEHIGDGQNHYEIQVSLSCVSC